MKHGQLFALLIGLLAIVVFLITVSSGLSGGGYDMSTDLNALTDGEKSGIGFFNPILMLTIALVVIAAILAFIVFGIINILKFPKSSMKFILGVVGLIVLFVIFYSMASTGADGKLTEIVQKFTISDGTLKMISGGIMTTLLLVVGAVLLIVVSEVRNVFK